MTIGASADADALNVFLNTAMADTATIPGVVALIDTATGRAWAVHDNPAGGLCVDSGRADDLAAVETSVTGTATALLAWLRGEGSADSVAVSGDLTVTELLRGSVAT